MTNNNGKYKERENYRKFSTITDTDTGGEFVFLCKALDVSIYKRLRTLIERDIKANRGIIGSIPEDGEQFPDRFLPPEDNAEKQEKSETPTRPPFPLPMTKGDDLHSISYDKSVKSKQESKTENNQEDNDRPTIF